MPQIVVSLKICHFPGRKYSHRLLRVSVGVCFLRSVGFLYLCLGIHNGILGCIVKHSNEVCPSHMKHIGENKSFTTQVVRRGAAHWINLKKLLENFIKSIYF